MAHRLFRASLVPVLLWLATWPAWGAVSLYVAPEQLAAHAPLIVEAVVARSASAVDPATGRVATYVTLEIAHVLRGPADLERVVLRELGGRSGDLVLDIDAVPRYAAGESVLAYLEPGSDGALRTAGMFFGMFRVETAPGSERTELVRDLDGRGRILFGPVAEGTERFSRADVWSMSVSAGDERARPGTWHALPPEFHRLDWDDPVTEKFLSLSTALPARWSEADTGAIVSVGLERSDAAPGGPDAAVAEVSRALEAWTAVPEARIALSIGEPDSDYVASHALGPAAVYGGENIVLFGDPYDEIADSGSGSCSGVLALGGYWRTAGVESRVNGIDFAAIRQLYVVFNDGLDCFLASADNLAEVATHELGHGLGFGHSPAPDAIMRATAHGGRGPRLGEDDCDAAHCHYPHTISIERPAGGESWPSGSRQTIEWSASTEAGPDPGSVDLEYSTDDGATWRPIASAVPNDGRHDWVVPPDGSAHARVRLIRYRRGGFAPEDYPEHCTAATSSGSFDMRARTAVVERTITPRIVRYRGQPARGTEHAAGSAPSSSP